MQHKPVKHPCLEKNMYILQFPIGGHKAVDVTGKTLYQTEVSRLCDWGLYELLKVACVATNCQTDNTSENWNEMFLLWLGLLITPSPLSILHIVKSTGLQESDQ